MVKLLVMRMSYVIPGHRVIGEYKVWSYFTSWLLAKDRKCRHNEGIYVVYKAEWEE